MKHTSFIVTIIIFMTTMSSGCLENGFFGSEKLIGCLVYGKMACPYTLRTGIKEISGNTRLQ